MKTIVAIFDDISLARQVVEDLVRADFARNSISLITNDAQNQYSHFLEKDYKPRTEAVTALEGAGLGLIVGALTGILLSLATFLIPSLGLTLNPIMSAAIGAVIGALIGTMIAAVIKITVAEDESPYYAEAIKRGATLISIVTSTPRQAEEIMHRYGTVNLHERISQWRQAGWIGFEPIPKVEKDDTKPWVIPNAMTKETSSVTNTPLPLRISAEKVDISIVEPKTGDEDTEKSSPIIPHESEISSFDPSPKPEPHFDDVAQDSAASSITKAQESSVQD